jgi:hypothetical protein
MASAVFFNSYFEKQAEGVFNLGSDVLKLLLSNVAPDAATDTVKADLTEISAGNGYTAGGLTVTVTTSSQTAGVYTLNADDPVLTASGGSVATFQYAILYDDTASGDPLVMYWDMGSPISVADVYSFVLGGALLTSQAG